MTRRSLSLRAFGLGITAYGAGALLRSEAAEAALADAMGRHRVLVTVFLDGGADMLSVLAPFGVAHEARARALRPGLMNAIPADQLRSFSADPSLSWHPSAGGLRTLWDSPDVNVAIAPAVGYASPNYSHFTSRHFWEVGALDTGGTTGWLGRYLDRVGRSDVPIQGLSLGTELAPSLATANVPVATLDAVEGYSFGLLDSWGSFNTDGKRELRELGARASGDAQTDQVRLASKSAYEMVDVMGAASSSATATVPYPTTSSAFSQGLKDTARLLGTRIGGQALPLRCVALRAHGGYDTHGTQYPSFGNNLKVTTDAIAAFWADLRARGEDDRVTMLVYSEFGRRPQENGSGGCDHGAAGGAFVIGKAVKQGLIGEFPGLKAYGTTGAGLMQDGNLRATSDFRGIYSALLEQWMGTDAEGIIPGAGLKPGSGAFARPVLF